MKNEKSIIVMLPFLPPSVNEAYAGYPRRHKTQKYKDFESRLKHEMQKRPRYIIEGSKFLRVSYEFHFPIFFKNGNIRKRDLGNFEKILTDCLGKHIKGFLDEKIAKITMSKTNSDLELTWINIQEM